VKLTLLWISEKIRVCPTAFADSVEKRIKTDLTNGLGADTMSEIDGHTSPPHKMLMFAS
jgi:hypothetical protein